VSYRCAPIEGRRGTKGKRSKVSLRVLKCRISAFRRDHEMMDLFRYLSISILSRCTHLTRFRIREESGLPRVQSRREKEE